MAVVVVLQGLYGYVFDASNRSRDADEDRVNNPHRRVDHTGGSAAAGSVSWNGYCSSKR
ncbi:hypothetical protein [Allokutzneria sp. NRRL B-24872]|uniref:hypothetical protein n=1 Tax=Allokutzneria sp. NRRL B-24872 TaxID=1137961 RepID=UPI00143CF5C8|nr:hypothetical protein [Allokutzneria sp. NRRL B-24872]